MNNDVLGQFLLPQRAVEDLGRQNRQQVVLDDGVSRFMAGHDGGVPYRFFIHADYNEAISKAKRYEAFDEIIMIEWIKDRKNKYTERVHFLPPALLEFETWEEEVERPDKKGATKKVIRYGDCIGGKYKEAFDRFREGKRSLGTTLRAWGVFSEGQLATLEAMSIFTVEQFAESTPNRIKNLPPEFHAFYERSKQFMASKEGRYEVDKQAEEILALTARLDRQAQENSELKAQMESLMKLQEPVKRARGPNKKKAEVTEEAHGN